MKPVKPFNIVKNEPINDAHPVHTRVAVRGLIIKDHQCLFLKTNDGDLIFPGGGLEGDEPHEQALRRETVEETGLEAVPDCYLGTYTKRHPDIYHSERTYEEISHYYIAKLTGKSGAVSLETYEQALDMRPVWMPLSDAIKHNETMLATQTKPSKWLQRDLDAMKLIQLQLMP